MASSWITSPISAELVRGAAELEHTEAGVVPHRLPGWARAQCSDGQLAMAEAQPAGVRLVFRTAATAIELETLRTKLDFKGMPPRPDGRYDLLVDGQLAGQVESAGGNTILVDATTGATETVPGPVGTIRFTGLAGREKEVQIWLPFNELTRLVAVRTDAPIAPVPIVKPVWLHHGSSISHGSNAASPTTTWAAQSALGNGVELINLGLSGSALLDPFIARTMRDTPADLVSVKIGINLVNSDLMRLRAFGPAVHGFLDTIRDGHPDQPLLVISPIYCPIHEDTPGPGVADFGDGRIQFAATGDPAEPGKLTLTVIRDELHRIVKQRSADDPNLHYLDGLDLYGEPDFAEFPLPDRLHPDPAAHLRIAEHFTELAFGPGGPFSSRG